LEIKELRELKASLNELLTKISHSTALNEDEKKIYSQMIHCVADYGIDNDFELFLSSDYCFDVDFGAGCTHNIITTQNYLSIMGEDVKGTLGENDDINADYFAHDRPGFFLLTPGKAIYLLKEGTAGSLVYYDVQQDAFVDSSSIQISGQEKLAVLNKSTFPLPDAFFGTPTPRTPIEGKFYHEKQERAKCGIHAIHAFIGFSVVNETELSLMRLEEIAEKNRDVLIEKHCLERGLSNSLSPSQIGYFQDLARFNMAQTAAFLPELGNVPEHILKILHHMADRGTIESKYKNTSVYEVNIPVSLVKYAKQNGYDFETEGLDINLMQKLIDEAPAATTSMKKALVDAIQWINRLKEEFERSDRLIISSFSELHVFTMRKSDSNHWVVIDSLESTQLSLEDPFKWLLDRQKSLLKVKGSCSYQFITINQ